MQRPSPCDGRSRHRDLAVKRHPVRDAVDVLLPTAEQRLFAREHHHATREHAQGYRRRGRRAAAIIRSDPSVERVFERINVGEGHVNIVLKKNREFKSTEFERNLSPTLAAIPDARVSFQSQQAAGPTRIRATSCFISAVRTRPSSPPLPTRSPRKWQGVPGLRAPRVGSNLAQPEITIKPRLRPRRQPRRDHGCAQPDDADRNARRHRAEQREILAVRPAGADPGLTVGKRPSRSVDAREPAGPDLAGGSVPLKAVADIGFGVGADDHQPLKPASPAVDRRGPRARGRRRRCLGEGQRASGGQEPAAGRPENEPRQPKVAGGVAVQLRDRVDLRRAAGVRGAGASLPARSWRRS